MPKFSKTSKSRLETCHKDLQVFCEELIKYIDFSVLEGHRNQERQDLAYQNGKSKLKYPKSRHNLSPSMAVDLAPYPINWDNLKRWYYFGGNAIMLAKKLYLEGKIKHKIRWGGDWNGNDDLDDQTFNDLPHFELRKY